MKQIEIIGLAAVVTLWGGIAHAATHFSLTPKDLGFSPTQNDDAFAGLKPIGLEASLTIGSDCGKINIEGTLGATFNKVVNGEFFKGLTGNIISSAPMLITCYASPTWCSVLKHTQIAANLLTQTRLDQCSIIDKYVDSRVEDYYRNRQECAHKNLASTGGDMEKSLHSCVDESSASAELSPWTGPNVTNHAGENHLIEDSAKWAGYGEKEQSVTDLVKSLVGDVVLAKGNLSVEFGPKHTAYSPRLHLNLLEKEYHQDLCGKILPELATAADADRFIDDQKIQAQIRKMAQKNRSGENEHIFDILTPDLIRNLAYLPAYRRRHICLKLSQAMAMQTFTQDMNRSLDMLSVAAQNPHLPPNRKSEIESKRVALKDQIDVTLKLQHEQSKPMGDILQYAAEEGINARNTATQQSLSGESAMQSNFKNRASINDCSDEYFCDEIPRRRDN